MLKGEWSRVTGYRVRGAAVAGQARGRLTAGVLSEIVAEVRRERR